MFILCANCGCVCSKATNKIDSDIHAEFSRTKKEWVPPAGLSWFRTSGRQLIWTSPNTGHKQLHQLIHHPCKLHPPISNKCPVIQKYSCGLFTIRSPEKQIPNTTSLTQLGEWFVIDSYLILCVWLQVIGQVKRMIQTCPLTSKTWKKDHHDYTPAMSISPRESSMHV